MNLEELTQLATIALSTITALASIVTMTKTRLEIRKLRSELESENDWQSYPWNHPPMQ